jgi:predicted nucleic acid-binding protein
LPNRARSADVKCCASLHDSNIYISAMNFGGAPDELLDMARNGDIVLAISDPIVEEVPHVLHDKLAMSPKQTSGPGLLLNVLIEE